MEAMSSEERSVDRVGTPGQGNGKEKKCVGNTDPCRAHSEAEQHLPVFCSSNCSLALYLWVRPWTLHTRKGGSAAVLLLLLSSLQLSMAVLVKLSLG